MGYSNAERTSYSFGGFTVATAGQVRGIPRMPGKRFCRIVDIVGVVTTAVVATSTAAKIGIGDGTTATKFANQTMASNAQAIGATNNLRTEDGRVAAYATSAPGFIDWDNDGDGGAALTKLVLTPSVGVGGSVAGVYDATVVIDWW